MPQKQHTLTAVFRAEESASKPEFLDGRYTLLGVISVYYPSGPNSFLAFYHICRNEIDYSTVVYFKGYETEDTGKIQEQLNATFKLAKKAYLDATQLGLPSECRWQHPSTMRIHFLYTKQ